MNIMSMSMFRNLFFTGVIRLELIDDIQLNEHYHLVDSEHYGYHAGNIFTGVLLYNPRTETYIQRDIRINPLTLEKDIETYVLKDNIKINS